MLEIRNHQSSPITLIVGCGAGACSTMQIAAYGVCHIRRHQYTHYIGRLAEAGLISIRRVR